MFEQTFVQSQAKTRKPWTVVMSLSLQCGVVALVLLFPLLHPDKLRIELPKPRLAATWVNLQPAPIPKTQAANTSANHSTPHVARQIIYPPTNSHITPTRVVDAPTIDPDFPALSGSSTTPFGPSLNTAVSLPPQAVPQPPPAPVQPKPVISGPLRVSEGVQGARLTFGPHPAYPQIAIAARSQGTVKLEAIIAADGSIRNLRVISGPPLLVNAARDAVWQWRYHPTLLNGVAVEVLTEIDVNFTLGH
jgi:protein TonB